MSVKTYPIQLKQSSKKAKRFACDCSRTNLFILKTKTSYSVAFVFLAAGFLAAGFFSAAGFFAGAAFLALGAAGAFATAGAFFTTAFGAFGAFGGASFLATIFATKTGF
jgi:hypothetical protein